MNANEVLNDGTGRVTSKFFVLTKTKPKPNPSDLSHQKTSAGHASNGAESVTAKHHLTKNVRCALSTDTSVYLKIMKMRHHV